MIQEGTVALKRDGGTEVAVHNFFYCFPVRKKLINEAFELAAIKQKLIQIALVYPHISYSLTDLTSTKLLLLSKRVSLS